LQVATARKSKKILSYGYGRRCRPFACACERALRATPLQRAIRRMPGWLQTPLSSRAKQDPSTSLGINSVEESLAAKLPTHKKRKKEKGVCVFIGNEE
jgi:hypothetical protein